MPCGGFRLLPWVHLLLEAAWAACAKGKKASLQSIVPRYGNASLPLCGTKLCPCFSCVTQGSSRGDRLAPLA